MNRRPLAAGAACEVLLQLLPQWRFSALWAAWAAAGGPGRVLTALEQWMKPAAAGLTGRSSAGARSEGVARSALVLVQLQVRHGPPSPLLPARPCSAATARAHLV